MAPVAPLKVRPVGRSPAVRVAGTACRTGLATTELVEFVVQLVSHQSTPTVPEMRFGAEASRRGVTGIVTPIWLDLTTGELVPVDAVMTTGKLVGVARGVPDEATEVPAALTKLEALGGSWTLT